MDALGIALLTAGITVILGGYAYTFLVQRDMTNKVEDLDRIWGKTADDMRKARDAQLGEIRSDAASAASENRTRLYEHQLYAANTFATVKSMEQLETRLAAMIGKVEIKVDRLTDFLKNGHDK